MYDANPTICEYWVGWWECVARSNPQASKSGVFDPDIILYDYGIFWQSKLVM